MIEGAGGADVSSTLFYFAVKYESVLRVRSQGSI